MNFNINKSIIIENKISEIGKVVELIEIIGHEQKIALKVIFDITLSLDELLTNVISYAYEDMVKHQIEVNIIAENSWVTINLIDDGKPFNPLEIDSPNVDKDLDDIAIGGLGIHLVKNKIDELAYKRLGNKNILTLKKKIGSNNGDI